TVNAGTLLVNGSIKSRVILNGGTLGGTGTVGNVLINSGARMAPGASPGILRTGTVTFAAGSSVTLPLTGASPGAGGYDQLSVTGGVTLAGGAGVTLKIPTTAPNGFVPHPGETFLILKNDGTDSLAGAGKFAGLPENAVVTRDFLGSGLTARI